MDSYSNLGASDDGDSPVQKTEAEEASAFSEEERADGLDGARFSYLFNFFGLPFCLIPLFKRDNAFSLFHAKQAFLVWVLFFASLVAGWSLCWISLYFMWMFILGGGLSLALNVLGHQRALNERDRSLPVVGALAEQWFSNLTVRDEEMFED